MRTFLTALSVLSIFPLGKFQPLEAELKRSIIAFAWVGLFLGVILYDLAWPIARFCPAAVAAMLLTLLPEVFTKGFHLDGLADTADGFLSGRERKRKLEIMRDSHIGTMGVAAIVAILGLRFSLYVSMPTDAMPIAAALCAIGGRCTMVWYVAGSRSARPDGLGRIWFEHVPRQALFWATAIPAGAALALLGWGGLCIPALIVALAWGWNRITAKVIGGGTGDTIGCIEELGELAVLALTLGLWS